MAMHMQALAGTVVVALVALSGCGGKSQGEVSGKVLFRGQPVTEGEVNFYSGERGAGAGATIDAVGKFPFPAPLRPGTYSAAVLPATKDPVPGAPPPRNAAPNIP